MLKQTELRTASLNEKKMCAVKRQEPTKSDVFRYLHGVPLPTEVPSLPWHFVFAGIHLQHGYPSDSSVTITSYTAFLYTLYIGMASSTKFKLFGQLYQYPDTICLH